MIVVTGAAGFIGSCLVRRLNDEGFTDLILVDDFHHSRKILNYRHKKYRLKVDRSVFLNKWLPSNHKDVVQIFHLGARTDTTSTDKPIFDLLNLNFSQILWNQCIEFGIPFIYASSAATYGNGEFGYSDDPATVPRLKPLNEYAVSKQRFDEIVLSGATKNAIPPNYAGFKFFNVYGPNEYHKGRMASVVFHGYRQIIKTEWMKLFRSHKKGIEDGMQQRDFIYVKDVLNVLMYFFRNQPANGIFNLGTGQARPFLDLAHGIFSALNREHSFDWMDTPENIRDTYQYFTQADMRSLRATGYKNEFTNLEDGIAEYVKQYLSKGAYY